MELDQSNLAETRRQVDAWVADHSPTSIETDLERFEARHFEQFLNDYGRGRAQFYVAYDTLLALVDEVNWINKDHWPPGRTAQFVLLSKNLKPFESSMDRLSKSYYQDAVSLVRGLYDAFLRLVHVSIYPDKWWGAIADKPTDAPHFNATGIVRDVLRLDWTRKYRLMSVYAHANTYEVLSSLERTDDHDADPEQFGLVFEEDPKLVEMTWPFLQLVLLGNLRFVIERLIGDQELRQPELLVTGAEAASLLTFSLAASSTYWADTMLDTDYLFEVLALADDGSDWQALRDRRPTVAPR